MTPRSLDNLWRNNPVLARLLGLCPLLAVSDSLVKALGLGLALLFVLPLSGLGSALATRLGGISMRLPVLLVIAATLVGSADILMQAYTYELHQRLGIFLPLLASSSLLLASQPAPQRPFAACIDATLTALGFLLVLLPMAALRELLGSGRLLDDARLLFGPRAEGWNLLQLDGYPGFPLPLLATGAFTLLGLLIALYNRLGHAPSRAPTDTTPDTPAP
ncbi:electron transport complex subunit RsxE [Pseudomonas sp. ABC1]|uniref:Rnf-Nqr domain containing protein n=1 Tax=Pseudomonas sp. ABC1 TaxID=2748080 RepID=UPI0015C3590D|nr:Rnf-Nqr domain containing protein [Pseudomonas sp. ABC1]QLF94312.1 electron transport complex subunit RsxE [Pseudomonas sp. ABC1]